MYWDGWTEWISHRLGISGSNEPTFLLNLKRETSIFRCVVPNFLIILRFWNTRQFTVRSQSRNQQVGWALRYLVTLLLLIKWYVDESGRIGKDVEECGRDLLYGVFPHFCIQNRRMRSSSANSSAVTCDGVMLTPILLRCTSSCFYPGIFVHYCLFPNLM